MGVKRNVRVVIFSNLIRNKKLNKMKNSRLKIVESSWSTFTAVSSFRIAFKETRQSKMLSVNKLLKLKFNFLLRLFLTPL